MNRFEVVKKLKEFNGAAIDIYNLSFVKKMQEPKGGFSVCCDAVTGMQAEFRGPDIEAIKAYCNDLRKFIQGNDSLSFSKLQPVYQSEFVTYKNRKEYGKIISNYRSYLEKNTNFRLNGEVLTRKKILGVFLYGYISHRSKKTKEVYDLWTQWDVTSALLKNEFVTILFELLHYINYFAIVNNDVLEQLGLPRITSNVDSNE